MRVYFRVDGSITIGAGHVIRCATLASELVKHGSTPIFICRAMPGNYIDWLIAKGFVVKVLTSNHCQREVQAQGGYSSWLGASLELELQEVFEFIRERGDWLVSDHYAIGRTWQEALRPNVRKVMTIDDLANRHYDCDLLLDQNLYPKAEGRYTGLLPRDAKTLLGPRYALLRPEFLASRKTLRQRNGQVQRLLVFMGGGDTLGITDAAINAIASSVNPSVYVDVVLGVAVNRQYVQAKQKRLPNIHFHFRVDRMAELMALADLAIGATGVATWERAALGLPTLAITLANNQREIAASAHEVGLLTWIGEASDISSHHWVSHLNEAFSSPERLRSQGEKCLALVDARGTQRVVEAML
jgi:UDP-2,4-diacetamido-2,4,6-trideoxy-beta-L-altropyranose hydrolase